MPKYFATCTDVRLAVCSLEDTTADKPEWKKSINASRAADAADRLLKEGAILTESNITMKDGETGLHFLGKDKEIPFYITHVGPDTVKKQRENLLSRHGLPCTFPLRSLNPVPTTPVPATPVPALRLPLPSPEDQALANPAAATPTATIPTLAPVREAAGDLTSPTGSPLTELTTTPVVSRAGTPEVLPSPQKIIQQPVDPSELQTPAQVTRAIQHPRGLHSQDLLPQALCLKITLNNESFIKRFDGKHATQDVKIDVFFNGELTASTFVAARYGYRGDPKSKETLTVVFAGRRIGRLVEHPWVLVPTSQNADGSLRAPKHTKAAKASAGERWKQIGEALQNEADIEGWNKWGERSPVGDYLVSVAMLDMPEAVEQMQKAGGLKFGVIDVVLSVGKGKKYDASSCYSMEPTRLKDGRYSITQPVNGPNSAATCFNSAFASLDPDNQIALRGLPMLQRAVAQCAGTLDDLLPEPIQAPASQPLQAPFTFRGKGPMPGYVPGFGRPLGTAADSQLSTPSMHITSQKLKGGVVKRMSIAGKQPRSQLASATTPPPLGRGPQLVPSAGYSPFTPFSPDQSDVHSSPEDGRHTRGQLHVGLTAAQRPPRPPVPLFPNVSSPLAPFSQLPSSQDTSSLEHALRQSFYPILMPPPPTPSSGLSSSPAKRSHSVALPTSGPSRPKRLRIRTDSLARESEDAQRGEGPLSVSPRGAFTRRASYADSYLAQGANDGTINTVVIRLSKKNKKSVARVNLSKPYTLRTNQVTDVLSPSPYHQLLPAADELNQTPARGILGNTIPSMPIQTPADSPSPTTPPRSKKHNPEDEEYTPRTPARSTKPASRRGPNTPKASSRRSSIVQMPLSAPATGFGSPALSSAPPHKASSRRSSIMQTPLPAPPTAFDSPVPSSTSPPKPNATPGNADTTPVKLKIKGPKPSIAPRANPNAVVDFKVPTLSQDSVITYAAPLQIWNSPPRAGGAAKDGGIVVRQIKSERPGDFAVDSVMLGVRFLVG